MTEYEYQNTFHPFNIARCIFFRRLALQWTSSTDFDSVRQLQRRLAQDLQIKFTITKQKTIAKEIISIARLQVQTHHDSSWDLHFWGRMLMSVHSSSDDKVEDEELLDYTINLCKGSLSLPAQSSPSNIAPQTTLALAYHARYEITKCRVDFESAIDSARVVYKEIQVHDEDSLRQKLLLPAFLLGKLDHNQSTTEINEALQALREIGAICQPQSTMEEIWAHQAFASVEASYSTLRRDVLLAEAIKYSRIADKYPIKDPEKCSQRLEYTAKLFFDNYRRHKRMDDLDESIRKLEQVSSDTARSNVPARVQILLAEALALRSQGLGGFYEKKSEWTTEALDEACGTASEAPEDDDWIHFATEWYQKAMIHAKEEKLRDAYLKNATNIVKRLLSNPSSTRSIATHARVLVIVGQVSQVYLLLNGYAEEGLGDPIAHYRAAWECHGASMNTRLEANHMAFLSLIANNQYGEAWKLSRQAVDLIPFICPSHLGPDDKKESILWVHGISRDACVAGLELGKTNEALEVLEQGRGLLVHNKKGTVDDNSRLEHEHVDLFRRFDYARYRLIGAGKASEPYVSRNYIPDQEMESMSTILSEIRQQPTYENFLRPIPAESMMRMATHGPVVVLVGSTMGSYAIIIKPDSIEHLDLNYGKMGRCGEFESVLVPLIAAGAMDIFSDEDIPYTGSNTREMGWKARQESFLSLLSLLWFYIVKPISDKLGLPEEIKDGDDQSKMNHITWIRTGHFSRLPVHMAMDASGVMFVQRATSSFVSSFRTFGIVKSNSKAVWRKKDRGLIITMSRPKWHTQPNGSAARPTETSTSVSLTKILELDQGLRSSSVDSIDPQSRRQLGSMRAGKVFISNAREEASIVRQKAANVAWTELERPSPHVVESQCADVAFLHVVAHGVTDPGDPFQSHLKLWALDNGKGHVDKLTVSQISQWTTRNACVAFLSACSTADAKEPILFEEGLDICTAFNVAGIPNVIGSIWPVPNVVGADMAGAFWESLSESMPDGGEMEAHVVALALNRATRRMMVKYPDDPLSWAGFIHSGGL